MAQPRDNENKNDFKGPVRFTVLTLSGKYDILVVAPGIRFFLVGRVIELYLKQGEWARNDKERNCKERNVDVSLKIYDRLARRASKDALCFKILNFICRGYLD